MGHYFKWLGSRDSARQLWENKESLDKYLAHLKHLMLADPNSRMTEDETKEQAEERARMYNTQKDK
jgi:CRISPR/Cas system CMR-associated protein Cmr5 small subunit